MKITPSIWMDVAGIKCEGLKVGKGNIAALGNFNKIHFFQKLFEEPTCNNEGISCWWLSYEPKNHCLHHRLDYHTQRT